MQRATRLSVAGMRLNRCVRKLNVFRCVLMPLWESLTCWLLGSTLAVFSNSFFRHINEALSRYKHAKWCLKNSYSTTNSGNSKYFSPGIMEHDIRYKHARWCLKDSKFQTIISKYHMTSHPELWSLTFKRWTPAVPWT